MVEIFRVEDRCAEPLCGGKERCVIIFKLISASEIESSANIGLIDRQKRECPKEIEPIIDDSIIVDRLAPRNIGEFGQCLARNSEKRTEHQLLRDVVATRIICPH